MTEYQALKEIRHLERRLFVVQGLIGSLNAGNNIPPNAIPTQPEPLRMNRVIVTGNTMAILKEYEQDVMEKIRDLSLTFPTLKRRRTLRPRPRH